MTAIFVKLLKGESAGLADGGSACTGNSPKKQSTISSGKS